MADVPQTIPAFLSQSVATRSDMAALGFIVGNELHWRTWREVADDVASLASRFRARGIAPGDRIAQASENRYEWIITDLAIHMVGAVHVPVHITLSGEQIAHQINDCGARLVVASNEELLAKFSSLIGPSVDRHRYDVQDARDPRGARADVMWSDFDAHPAHPDDLATILYTSGTTGRPRGVMLSQRNLASNAETAANLHNASVEQTRLCILPLSHIYARTCDLYTWVYRGSKLVLAESRETLLRDCQLVKPTTISAVPYVFQRVAEKVMASGAADRRAALHAAFGGQVEYMNCGGAPLSPELASWYEKHDLAVLVGYGLTETSPVVSASTLEARRSGRSGRPLANVEVRIGADGEIHVRGPNVMLGYWQDPQATQEAIRDGWFHTGDLGDIDDDGYLAIRGRKKELIVLSTGKKVVPTVVENRLATSPLIEQVAVFGDGDASLVALLVPAQEYRDADRSMFADEIGRCLASSAKEEQIRDFAIVARPFSIERGEMTAKLSLCRTVIAENFAPELRHLRESARSAKANLTTSSSD